MHPARGQEKVKSVTLNQGLAASILDQGQALNHINRDPVKIKADLQHLIGQVTGGQSGRDGKGQGDIGQLPLFQRRLDPFARRDTNLVRPEGIGLIDRGGP